MRKTDRRITHVRILNRAAATAIALIAFASTATAEPREGSATQKDLAARTLTIAGQTFAVTPETRLKGLDGVRITLAEFPVAESLAARDGNGETIASVVYDSADQTLTRVRIIETGG